MVPSRPRCLKSSTPTIRTRRGWFQLPLVNSRCASLGLPSFASEVMMYTMTGFDYGAAVSDTVMLALYVAFSAVMLPY